MSTADSSDTSRKDRRRFWKWIGRLLFAVLVIHFVLIYSGPEWLGLPGTRRYQQLRKRGFKSLLPSSGYVAQTSRRVELDGTVYLKGGPGKQDWFDIGNLSIDVERLHYMSTGREQIPALLNPEYGPAVLGEHWRVRDVFSHGGTTLFGGQDPASDQHLIDDDSEVIVVNIGDEARLFPITMLQHHEVINDTIGGRPVAVAYCLLARLGAVFDRSINAHTFTFAVSGYVHRTKERKVFVLWDRDTESLWLPTIGKAISGPMLGTPLTVLDPAKWRQTTWGEARRQFPEALVLLPNQQYRGPNQSSFRKHTLPSTQPATVDSQ